MTLDDAISHTKEKASELRRRFEDIYGQEEQTEAERKEAIACLDCANDHEQLAEWLTELKQRREADRWIPVSEKLPEKDGKFLICTASGFVESSIFMFGKFSIPYVIAWKHLPKPYESEVTKND